MSGLSTPFPSRATRPTAADAAKRAGVARHRVRALLHGLLLATTFLIFAWQIAVPAGLVFGAGAAIAGTMVAERLIASRWRLPVILGIALGVLASGYLLGWLSVSRPTFATLIGAGTALEIQDALRWGALAGSASLALRSTAIRYRAALAIEGGLVVLAVATTVAAHRDGMIARPLDVSDWFWTQGIDPVVAFLAIGLAGALLLAGVLAYGRSPMRTLFQLALILLLGIAFASYIHGRDPSSHRDVIGGEGKGKDDKRNQQAGGGGGKGGDQKANAKQDPNASPFEDGMPKPPNSGGGAGQNRPAAIVVFHKDAQPASGVFYFRHAVFSQYNGIRLIEATVDGVDPDADARFPTERRKVPGVPEDTDTRETVATDVALLTEHNRMFSLTDAVEVEPMANPNPARFQRAYRVVSKVITAPYNDLIGLSSGDPSWSDEVWQHYTELPRDERYHKLAAELLTKLKGEYADDPVARAMIVKRYLEENTTYSFKRNYEGEEDPTGAFLFSEEKLGYCVHTSHAAAYLLRAMGVPARVSAGYAIPAQNLGGGSSLLIKSSDAHAWAEIYLQNVGWVPIEVTPEKTDVPPTPFNEQDLQQLLGEMARKEGRTQRAQAPTPQILKTLRAILAMVPSILLALLAIAYVTKLWRLAAPWLVPVKARPRVAYRAALDRFSAVGIFRESGESRESFADRVVPMSPTFERLTDTHVGAALGSTRIFSKEAELRALPGKAREVGGELRRSIPWWRWVIGVLNPINFFWSR